MGNKNRDRGNSLQRYMSKRLGGLNVGILGGEDIMLEGGKFSIEVKERQSFAGWKFMEQAINNSSPKKIPIVILHILKKSHNTDLVMIQLKDWEEIIKDLK